jgi:hypothetical protein
MRTALMWGEFASRYSTGVKGGIMLSWSLLGIDVEEQRVVLKLGVDIHIENVLTTL